MQGVFYFTQLPYQSSYSMNSKWVSPVVLVIIMLTFLLAKWSSLSLPYFWDEAWSYILAIHTMANQSPCFLPGCIDTELYRGHPLFLYFLSATWLKFISPSLFSMHLFAMLISIWAIVSFYRLCAYFLPAGWALFAAGFLVMQQAFFVQSSFVLPEILLMLLTTEAAIGFLKNQTWKLILSLILLTLTKETGIIIGLGFFMASLFIKKQAYRQIIWTYLIAFIPCLLFYLDQKIKLGWFFYPFHQDLVDFSYAAIKLKAGIIFHFLFIDQGRKILIPALSLLTIFYMWRKAKYHYVVLIVLGLLACASYFLESAILCLVQLVIAGILFWEKRAHEHKLKQLAALGVSISILVVAFSSINFLMLRYLLVLLPFLLLAIFILLHKVLKSKSILIPATCFLYVIHGFMSFHFTFYKRGWHDDVSINYLNMVRVHQQVVSLAEENNWQENNVYTHFLMKYYLTRKETGYLGSNTPFAHVRHEGTLEPDDEIIIISTIEQNDYLENAIHDGSRHVLLKRFQIHHAWSEVYGIKE